MLFNEYLTKLASAQPVPGGGSAAMVVGATGCALIAMVARICDAQRLVERADALRAAMLRHRERDEEAFARVVAAQALSRDSQEQRRVRTQTVQQALQAAAEQPLEGATAALAALHLCVEALELRNEHLISDVGCAAEFAHAALAACAYNVRINHKYMKDARAIATQRERLERYEREGAALVASIRRAVSEQLSPR